MQLGVDSSAGEVEHCGGLILLLLHYEQVVFSKMARKRFGMSHAVWNGAEREKFAFSQGIPAALDVDFGQLALGVLSHAATTNRWFKWIGTLKKYVSMLHLKAVNNENGWTVGSLRSTVWELLVSMSILTSIDSPGSKSSTERLTYRDYIFLLSFESEVVWL